MTRYVGDIERISSVQHFLGFYRCVAVTARYTTRTEPSELKLLIEDALTRVILKHPVLCVGIVGEDTEKPSFVRLSSIDLEECVEFRGVPVFTPSEENTAIENILERQHSRQWQDLPSNPGWKIIVVKLNALPFDKRSIDIIFAYHHALADGISGLIFHNALLESLNSTTEFENLSGRVAVPKTISLPLPLEKQINFTISMLFLLCELWKARPEWMKCFRGIPAWTSNPPSLKQIQSYRSRSKIISIDAYQLESVLASCRRQKATLTGLLHGITVVSFTSHVPQAKRFEAGVPCSLRHLLDEDSKGEMGCYAWGCSIGYGTETVSEIRSSRADGHLTNEIWDIARKFSPLITAELDQLPNDSIIGVLHRVEDLHRWFKSRIGKPRTQTFEVSNIGAFKNGAADQNWRIERMTFSQSGIATGPAVSFNVVSVAGGPLTISATWMEGAIEETIVNLVCEDIMRFLSALRIGTAT